MQEKIDNLNMQIEQAIDNFEFVTASLPHWKKFLAGNIDALKQTSDQGNSIIAYIITDLNKAMTDLRVSNNGNPKTRNDKKERRIALAKCAELNELTYLITQLGSSQSNEFDQFAKPILQLLLCKEPFLNKEIEKVFKDMRKFMSNPNFEERHKEIEAITQERDELITKHAKQFTERML